MSDVKVYSLTDDSGIGFDMYIHPNLKSLRKGGGKYDLAYVQAWASGEPQEVHLSRTSLYIETLSHEAVHLAEGIIRAGCSHVWWNIAKQDSEELTAYITGICCNMMVSTIFDLGLTVRYSRCAVNGDGEIDG